MPKERVVTNVFLQQMFIFTVPAIIAFLWVGRKTQAPRDEIMGAEIVAHNQRLLAHRNDPERVQAMNKILFGQTPEDMKDRFIPKIDGQQKLFKGSERFQSPSEVQSETKESQTHNK
eukprot:c7205_g1_i2.p1 GENE.c7205_g1_i2~~c7205_g1_i2.p1  ORF type:complete len:117 (+),score=45.32 c7205_g1_i2:27-377(+)